MWKKCLLKALFLQLRTLARSLLEVWYCVVKILIIALLFSVLKYLFREVLTHKMGREDKTAWKSSYFTKLVVSIKS